MDMTECSNQEPHNLITIDESHEQLLMERCILYNNGTTKVPRKWKDQG